MNITIAIGFGYIQTQSECLSGTLIDLFLIHRFFAQYSNVHIFTDLEEDINGKSLLSAIRSNIISSKATVFNTHHLIKTQDDLFSEIENVLSSQFQNIIIYYTGHGIKGNIKLPDLTNLSFQILNKKINELGKRNIKIIWITDCCYGPSFNLPYILKDDGFLYKENIDTHDCEIITFISSRSEDTDSSGEVWRNKDLSDEDQISASTSEGSLFTRYFVKALQKTRNLGKIRKYIVKHLENHLSKFQGHVEIERTIPQIVLCLPLKDFEININYDIGFILISNY